MAQLSRLVLRIQVTFTAMLTPYDCGRGVALVASLIRLVLTTVFGATPKSLGVLPLSVFAFTVAQLTTAVVCCSWRIEASSAGRALMPFCSDITLDPLDENVHTMPTVTALPGEKFTFKCFDPYVLLKCRPAYRQFRYWKLNGKILVDSEGCRPNDSDSSINVYLYRNAYDEPDLYYQLAGTAKSASHQGPVECAYRWSQDTFFVRRSYLTVVSEDLHVVAVVARPLNLRCTDDDRLVDGQGNNLTAVESVNWYWSSGAPSSVDSAEYQLVFSHGYVSGDVFSKQHSHFADRRSIYVLPRNPLTLTVRSVRHSDAGTYKCEAMTALLRRTTYGIRRVSVWDEPVHCPEDAS